MVKKALGENPKRAGGDGDSVRNFRPRRRRVAIDRVALDMDATVPDIDEARFQELAQAAKAGCPVSKALGGVPAITLVARLRR